ncbi:MAG: sensor histidine kinase [Chitinophagaceae bacterium]
MRYLSQIFVWNSFVWRRAERKASAGFRLHSRKLQAGLLRVKRIGLWKGMTHQEKSKLAIFNYLNFFQLFTGIIFPFFSLIASSNVPTVAWVLASLPPLVSASVLVLNAKHLYNQALLAYFILYPFTTCLAYLNGVDLGIELSFVLYGILSVFFIADRTYMLLSIGFSMISYFVLAVMLNRYPFQLENSNIWAYLVNQAIAIVYIFYGLYLIQSENRRFNESLQQANHSMQEQARQLQWQAEELAQLNSLKSRLFSVIAHDLKAPMYALRNLFENILSQDMPGGEIKALVPDIKKDLNDTVGLMENLLRWAKSQMEAEIAHPAPVQMNDLIEDVVRVLHLQSEAKNIEIKLLFETTVTAWADADMIHLVLRNLVSNAIKFTEENGSICVGINRRGHAIEIYVSDSGNGIAPELLQKMENGEMHTTPGTRQEQGTGLGLLLCREFLTKNSSQLRIESVVGKGSRFSFLLPMSDV